MTTKPGRPLLWSYLYASLQVERELDKLYTLRIRHWRSVCNLVLSIISSLYCRISIQHNALLSYCIPFRDYVHGLTCLKAAHVSEPTEWVSKSTGNNQLDPGRLHISMTGMSKNCNIHKQPDTSWQNRSTKVQISGTSRYWTSGITIISRGQIRSALTGWRAEVVDTKIFLCRGMLPQQQAWMTVISLNCDIFGTLFRGHCLFCFKRFSNQWRR